jgi:IS1 family transposase
VIGERSQEMANNLVANTAKHLGSMPLFVTDGLKIYSNALLKQYGQLQVFPRTGKRGRPRSPRLVASDLLKYAQVIKERAGNTLKKVIKRIIYGKDIDPRMISTSYIERLNLTCRQDNNRISRKTIGFSKRTKGLYEQMILFFANYNYCRKHLSLENEGEKGKNKFDCPAKRAGLIDRIWSLSELLTYPYYKTQTY